MAKRARDFGDRLLPAGPEMAARSISPMLLTMISRQGDEIEHRARLAIYLADLAWFPAWAINEAATRFRRGVCGDGKFLPTPGEMVRECSRLVGEVATQKQKIEEVLAARVFEPIPEIDRRAIVDRAIAASVVHLERARKLEPSDGPVRTPEEMIEIERERLAAKAALPIFLSDSLLKSIRERAA